MGKTDRLKAKLRSADRRRKKRNASAASERTSEPTGPTVDIAGILVDVILRESDRHGLRDSAVVAALRGLAGNSEARSMEGQRLQAAMSESLQKAAVSPRECRKPIDELLKLALANQDPETPDGFIRYISLISA